MRRNVIWAFLLLIVGSYPAYMRTPKAGTQKVAQSAKPDASSRKPQAGNAEIIKTWMQNMSLRDRVAQLVMISSFGDFPSSRSAEHRSYVRAVRDLRVGGIIVVNRVVSGSVRSAEPFAMAAFLNRMQRLARVPLVVGADFERGASMRVSGTAKFPHLMAYGATGNTELTASLGHATAREARALGVHWVFAPDADVNNNPDNPIISIRSFGENPLDVGRQVQAFIRGAHSDPSARVLVTAKHFPGHGDTNVDSHMGMPVLKADRPRLDQVELAPFRAAIEAGVDAVMTAHMAVPALEPEPIPATVSKAVLTDLLRKNLKFKGLIVTDAMDMAGLTKEFPGGEASVRALEAGADILLMPANPEASINAVTAAVRNGRLSARRIDESVVRVLSAKVRVGLHSRRIVNTETISDVLEDPELHAGAQLAADRAITLVKNDKDLIPLRYPERSCLYVLAEGQYSQQGRRMLEEIKARSEKMRTMWLHPRIPAAEIERIASDAAQCETAIVAAFASVGAYRGNVALAGNYTELVEKLIAGQIPVALITLGNPYVLRSFPQVDAYLTTYSPAITAEIAAVKALLGEIPITGRLPVTIPAVAKYGDGIISTKSSAERNIN